MFSAQAALHLTSDAAAMRLHSLRSVHAHSAYTMERSSLGHTEAWDSKSFCGLQS